ncbi:MAG: DUF3159 domain-containing protein [Actinobacteria bacterium]|nr:DUF3159 domain-containing protein [Actinomycetota bacterium]
MPIVLFIGLNRLAGLGWAVLGATVWSVKVAVDRHRRGEAVGKFLPILVGYLVVRGTIGILTDSEAVYFGIGIGTKACIGVALMVTSLVGRPFLGRVFHLALPVDRATRAHPAYLRMTSRLTVVWGAWLLATSVWDVWLFNQTSADGYVLIRALVGWPTGILLTLGAFWYADRALRAVPGFPGLMHLLEEQDERRRKG